MNVHKNARLTRHGREPIVRLVGSGQTPKAVSEAAGVCPRTVRKWVERYRCEGLAGLRGRSSRRHRLRKPTPQAVVEQVEALRRLRRTGKQIAAELAISPATVSRVLKRLGLNRIDSLEPPAPVRRYERAKPGEIIHIDIKNLGRFNSVGHRITGDRKGRATARVSAGNTCTSPSMIIRGWPTRKSCRMRNAGPVCSLFSALRFFRAHGIKVERVMTDNGVSFRSLRYAKALRLLKIKHLYTKPYRPKTTEKPSASCKRRCANGPMQKPICIPTIVPPSCRTGCIATTGIDRMVA